MAQAAQKREYSTEGTLYVAFELSGGTWKLVSATGKGSKRREKNVVAGDMEGVLREFAQARKKLGLAEDAPVVSCYEAGQDGFWLHRELVKAGAVNLVVDPSSIDVNRRAKRRKTDRLDGHKLLDHLLRWSEGERTWSVVQVPSVEDEDARQLHRELGALKAERTRHSNRIRSLLVLYGVRVPVSDDFPARLAQVRQKSGEPLPEQLRARLAREYERLMVVERQIEELEAKRRELLRTSTDPKIEMVRRLMKLRAVGINAAWVWVMEFFSWRDFSNRREVGSLAGLTPTPFASGGTSWEQGIDKAGNPRIRAMTVEIVWCWLRYQPNSAMSRWFAERFGHGNRRMRRIGVVALARKLLVAIWRYLKFDALPEGAELKAA